MRITELQTVNWGLSLTPSLLFCRKLGVDGDPQEKFTMSQKWKELKSEISCRAPCVLIKCNHLTAGDGPSGAGGPGRLLVARSLQASHFDVKTPLAGVFPCPLCRLRAKVIEGLTTQTGGETTSKQLYRTCVRMSAKEYELLKKKSATAGLSINAWLMAQLESNRPTLHREEETWEAIRFMDEGGREINVTARDFNSGYGTVEQLQSTIRRLAEMYERLHALRKKGYIRAL